MSILLLAALVIPSHADEADSTETETHPIETSFAWRNAFLPPGIPSVAVRSDETAMLWNPAGMAFSGTYFFGYSWKGTYYQDHLDVSTHFFLSKAKGFGVGYVRDSYSEGVQNEFLLSLAPHFSHYVSIGWTGKWKGAFNYDVGAILKPHRQINIGFVARDLRERDNTRRYYDSGLAIILNRRVLVHYDVSVEDSDWRIATAHGGGLYISINDGFAFGASYFDDGEGNNTAGVIVKLMMPRRAVDGDYSYSTDDWQTLGVRISSHNP